MGSKKHKKHKERRNHEEDAPEQRPLKLVLKVPSSSGNSLPGSSTMYAYNPEQMPLTFTNTLEPKSELKIEDAESSKFSISFDQQDTGHHSSRKMKKKKSKKKHHKHSHHHSHHHHHHHRRRSSCHHSKSTHHENIPTTPRPSAPLATDLDSAIINKSPQRSIAKKDRNQFQHFLSHLLKSLQRKDVQTFFAWPVTDLIAPGYSSIITQPMDFSTMKKKIEQNIYENLQQFRQDVKLICDNAMLYNRPDTIYYKAARKLWHYAKCKVFNKSSIAETVRSYPGLGPELGLDLYEESNAMEIDFTDNSISERILVPEIEDSKLDKDLLEDEEMNEEDMTAEQILEQAKKAAKRAADKLTLEKPAGAHLAILRQRNDGTTTLGILGDHTVEKRVTLESLASKLSEGIPYLPPYKEPECNRVKPIESANSLPFSSHLPSHDSTRSNITAKETQLLLSTYGDDELALQYSQSLLQFASGNDYVLHLVDSLLDVLTQGQHSKTMVKLNDLQKEKDDDKQKEDDVDMEIVKDDLQSQLDSANSIIHELADVQHKRLSSSTQPIKPAKEEQKLADLLTSKLTELISSYATPGEVSDSRSIRKAMGIQIKSE